jgi:hypothetical protein
MTTKLIVTQTINFAVKSDFTFSNQLSDSKLIIEVNFLLSNLARNNQNFGRVQPIFFVRENGFVLGQPINLAYGKNFIDIDSSFAINYRLQFAPYKANRNQTKISIYRKLLPENINVISLNDSNLFIGNI